MRESSLQNEVRLTLGGQEDIVVWRNHVALAVPVNSKARPQWFGLGTGSADLVGACRVEITEAHVGRQLGVMFAVELKSAKGRKREEQELWLNMVRRYGVRSGIARTVDEALAIAKGTRR